MQPVQHHRMLGIHFHNLTESLLFELIIDAIERGEKRIIANHNLHSVYLYHHHEKMAHFYETIAHYVFVDGMPLIWWGCLMGHKLTRKNRLTSMDWLFPLLKIAQERDWKIFYLGGQPNVIIEGEKKLREQYPRLKIKTHHGYFDTIPDSEENQAIIKQINFEQPDIILVGMGMPRQEYWILENYHHLDAHCILPIGAAMDYIAGVIPIPPRIMGRMGFEWLARLIAEPRRLWRRYLLEPLLLSTLLARDIRQRIKTLRMN